MSSPGGSERHGPHRPAARPAEEGGHDRECPAGVHDIVHKQDRPRRNRPYDPKRTVEVPTLVEPVLLQLLGLVASDFLHRRHKREPELARETSGTQ